MLELLKGLGTAIAFIIVLLVAIEIVFEMTGVY